jgi:hypothetical protein
MRARLPLSLLVVPPLLLAACELDLEDALFLSGTAQGPAGSVLAVERSTTAAPSLLPPMERVADVAYEPVGSTIVREDGSWVAELLYEDTLVRHDGRLTGRAFRVSLTPDTSGRQTRVSVPLLEDDAELPPLALWEGRLAVSTNLGSVIYEYPEPPPAPVSPLAPPEYVPEGVYVAVEAYGEDGVAWRSYGPSGFFFLPWLLEDLTVGLRAVAQHDGVWHFDSLLRGPAGGKAPFRLELQLPPQPITLPRPVRSVVRGAACPAVAPDGPCPFADGRLASVRFPAGTSELVLELQEPTLIDVMLARGLMVQGADGVQLEVLRPGSDAWEMTHSFAVPPDDDGYGGDYIPPALLAREQEFFIWQSRLLLGAERPSALLARAVRLRPYRTSEYQGNEEDLPTALVALRELSFFAE